MAQGESLPKKQISPRRSSKSTYSYLKKMIEVAKKNGWDLEDLGLIPKDPFFQAKELTKEQILERNRRLRSIFKSLSALFSPPVPTEVEQFIRNKPAAEWLPWERETIERIEKWRAEIAVMKPEIIDELREVIRLDQG
jgi:hypothetical protein